MLDQRPHRRRKGLALIQFSSSGRLHAGDFFAWESNGMLCIALSLRGSTSMLVCEQKSWIKEIVGAKILP